MTIRELSLKDYKRMVDIWDQAGLPVKLKGRDGPDTLRKQVASGTVFILGDVNEGLLRGVIVVSNDGRKGWMNRLAVLPKFRNQGIASGLIREAEKRLMKMGIEIFAAHIEEESRSSYQLFEKLGYVPATDIIYFVKRLRDEV
ncbi:MAG TPA: GNAT family N-acetyltransferase [Thermoplasmata archaeon]|nr:GNAT family N-acetyltransferase [Thermoplasmata archaeon]